VEVITGGRSGGSRLRLHSRGDNIGGPDTAWLEKTFSTSFTTFVVGFAFFPNVSFRTGTSSVVKVRDSTTGNLLIGLNYDHSNSEIDFVSDNWATFSTGVNTIAEGEWHYWELKVDISASGFAEGRQDGITVGSFSGNTLGSSSGTADRLSLFSGNASGGIVQGGGDFYFDDLYVVDGTGTVANDFVGDARILIAEPSASGDLSEWNGSDGDQIDNFELVDENPFSDSDYVFARDANITDLYGTSSLDSDPEIQGGDIFAVQQSMRAWRINETERQVAMMLKQGGVENEGSPHTPVFGTGRFFLDEHPLNPVTGLAWEVDDIGNIQQGLRTKT
jgi:hypothetical protein